MTAETREDQALMAVSNDVQRWQRDTFLAGMLPVIGIAGTSGKTTVVRLLDAILSAAGLRTATWTDLGVEIRGRRQRGELSGWSLALSRLAEGTIDIAIQELHWSTIHAVGLPPSSYPVLALTNLRGVSDAVWNLNSLQNATNAAMKIASAVHPNGVLVINGDDYSLVDTVTATGATPMVVAHSRESPALSRHLRAQKPSIWTESGVLTTNEGEGDRPLMHVQQIPLTMQGAANFQISNVMMAAAIASAVGIDEDIIRQTLSRFRSDPEVMPGSFNVWDGSKMRAVVSQLASSWQTRLLLRAVNPGGHRRQITVVGDLTHLEHADVAELGRLLGRYHGAILLHNNLDEPRLSAFRHGITANEYPPLIIHLPTERKAINRALRTARGDDVVLMLPSEDPSVSCRAISRFVDAQEVIAES